jgi:hypothetical protein
MNISINVPLLNKYVKHTNSGPTGKFRGQHTNAGANTPMFFGTHIFVLVNIFNRHPPVEGRIHSKEFRSMLDFESLRLDVIS